MKASASLGQAASMIAAPGSSILPSGKRPMRFVLAGANGREARIKARGLDWQPAARVLGDVPAVDVERVEGLRGLRRGFEERLRVVDLAGREAAVEELVEHVPSV